MNWERKDDGGLSKGDTPSFLDVFCCTDGRMYLELKQPKKSGPRDIAETVSA